MASSTQKPTQPQSEERGKHHCCNHHRTPLRTPDATIERARSSSPSCCSSPSLSSPPQQLPVTNTSTTSTESSPATAGAPTAPTVPTTTLTNASPSTLETPRRPAMPKANLRVEIPTSDSLCDGEVDDNRADSSPSERTAHPSLPLPASPTGSPTHKRRRTELAQEGAPTCCSPATHLRHEVREALAQETSPKARQSRLNKVYDTYRQRAFAAQSRTNGNTEPVPDASAPATDACTHAHPTSPVASPAESSAEQSEQETTSGNADGPRVAAPTTTTPVGVFPGRGARAGCEHYVRKCWIKAACCGNYYPCRRCHDENENHEIDRHATQEVACTACGEADQPVAKNCRRCGIEFARYFCGVCKFFDDREGHAAYHCEGCGICRVGQGVGIDNYHCNGCGICVPIDDKDSHPCRERSLDSNCPICTHHLATSTDQVVFLRCGHSMHVECLSQHTNNSYTCPICHKCLTDMTSWYRALDERLKKEVMPKEYANRLSQILCHDCDKKSVVPFHFVYHKCRGCEGYNTRVLHQFCKPADVDTPGDDDSTGVGAGREAVPLLQNVERRETPVAAVAPVEEATT